MTWACWRARGPLPFQLSLADTDLTGQDGWTCTRWDEAAKTAEGITWAVRILKTVAETAAALEG